jgi:hypothetical protein
LRSEAGRARVGILDDLGGHRVRGWVPGGVRPCAASSRAACGEGLIRASDGRPRSRRPARTTAARRCPSATCARGRSRAGSRARSRRRAGRGSGRRVSAGRLAVRGRGAGRVAPAHARLPTSDHGYADVVITVMDDSPGLGRDEASTSASPDASGRVAMLGRRARRSSRVSRNVVWLAGRSRLFVAMARGCDRRSGSQVVSGACGCCLVAVELQEVVGGGDESPL